MLNAGLTQQEFAMRLEISAASLSNIFNGKTNPTNTHVCAVHKAFPEVNINWLIFGEGEMFSGEHASESQNEEVSILSEPISSFSSRGEDLGAKQVVSEPLPNSAPVYNKGNSQRSQYAQIMSQSEDLKNAKNFDKPLRKVKEIRVFYDDGTYESFIPTVK